MISQVVKPDLNRLNWIKTNLRIIDKAGQLRSLRPNNGQLLLHAEMQQQRARDLPVRIVLLKPRRVGWSTWSEAEAFHDIHHLPNWAAMAVSLDADSTDTIFDMTKRFQRYLRANKPTNKTNKKQILFAPPHNSVFHAQTAGKIGVGRSFTAQFLHCSEVAFWLEAKTQLAGLYQIVDDSPGTVIILESTANGIGGAFYDKYWAAKQHAEEHPSDYREYRAVFFAWFEFPEYQTVIPDWWTRTEEEQDIAQLHGLSDEQLYWRRVKIAELDGDVSLFRQEYPATDLEAFQASGNAVFTPKMIASQEQHCLEGRTAVFTGPDANVDIENVDRRWNCWHIYQLPVAGRQYALGIDTMEGKISDIKDPKSKLDHDGMVMIDRENGDICAVWEGQSPPDVLINQSYWAGKIYNNAFIGVEMPMGFSVLRGLHNKGYRNLYNRETHDETLISEPTDTLGWRTTLITREWMVKDLITAIREQAIKIYHQGIVDQMKTFIKDKKGKSIHMPGKLDDLLFGLMIAIQIHQRCPMVTAMTQSHTSSEEIKEAQTGSQLAYSGAIDHGNEFDDDDNDNDYYDDHSY